MPRLAGDDAGQAPDPDLERMLREIAAKRLDTPRLAPARRRRAGPRGSRTTTSWTRRARERFEALVDRLRGAMLDRLARAWPTR